MIASDLDRKVMGIIRRNPGIRAVEIAARAGVPMPAARASLFRLKYRGRVTTAGATRATVYRVAR